MLTLLIAIMAAAYSKVKESGLVEGLHERAKMIVDSRAREHLCRFQLSQVNLQRLNPIGRPQVEHEQLFPGRQTYARYLHVAEAVAEDEALAAWDGLGGRLKALRREVVDVKANVKDVKADMKAGQSVAKADMADVKADIMEEVKAGQAEVKAEMADMKALLEKLVAQSLQNAA